MPNDAKPIFERYGSDSDMTRFLTWTPHESIKRAHTFIERARRGWVDGSELIWSIWLRDTPMFAGMLSVRPQGPAVTLGYALAKSCWRQGFMSEVLRALIPSLLAQPEIWRVWAVCDVENVASAGVLEHVGMQREGVLRRWTVHPNLSPEPRDCFCYSIVKTHGQHTASTT